LQLHDERKSENRQLTIFVLRFSEQFSKRRVRALNHQLCVFDLDDKDVVKDVVIIAASSDVSRLFFWSSARNQTRNEP
jgi:hypothetical protein